MKSTTVKTYTTAIVLIPPDEVWEPIQKVRRVYDRNFHRWMPHITLLYPFAEREDFPKVVSALTATTASLDTFQTQLSHFDHFRHRKSCTIFLRPEPEELVIDLHASLLKALPDYDDTAKHPGGFHPHLSIGQFQHRRVRDNQQQLQSEWTSIRFEVKEISFIYRAPETGERFVVAETFTLGQEDLKFPTE